jgi:enoyl-CoA hydratase
MSDMVQVTHPTEGVAQMLVDTDGRHNFSRFELNERMTEELRRLAAEGTRVVVVGSAVEGKFLGHGWLVDIIGLFSGGETSGDPRATWSVMRELDSGPMVSIAAVEGEAWGHGAEVAWACDLRVASERAVFGQMEVNVGVTPGSGGSVRITRIAGEAAAMRLLLDGRPVNAQEALRMNLVHWVVAPGQALSAALEWAAWLASRPPQGLATNKRVLVEQRDLPVLDALKVEGRAFVERFSSPGGLDLVREAQARYDGGGDTYDAFGIPR